jgi:hypothetical protein
MFARNTLPPFTEVDHRLVCETPGCEREYLPPNGWAENYPHDLSATIRETAGAREGWSVDEYGQDRCPDHGTRREPYSAYPAGHPLAREDAEAREVVEDAEPAPAAVACPDGINVQDVTEAVEPFVTAYEQAVADEEARKVRLEAGVLRLTPHTGKHRGTPKREDETTPPPAKHGRPGQEQPAEQSQQPTGHVSLLVRLGLVSREPLVIDGDIDTTSEDTDEWLKPFGRGDTRATWQMRSSWIRRGWLRKRREKTTADDTTPRGMAA